MTEAWTQVATEAIDRLAPFGPVILQGLESARRQMGEQIERTEFVTAKSVYALLKATFERDGTGQMQIMLDNFCQEPEAFREEIIELVAARAAAYSGGFGRNLVALTNRWREEKRPLPAK
jgi:hypothetical protein